MNARMCVYGYAHCNCDLTMSIKCAYICMGIDYLDIEKLVNLTFLFWLTCDGEGTS